MTDAASSRALSDVDLAYRLAEVAGRLLLSIRTAGLFDAGALGAAGDHTANAFLVSALRALRPDDGLLSEEMSCDGSRLGQNRVWIVDPLDGTREYGEGRDDWAVHVGLAVDGVATIGAVALPAMGQTLSSGSVPSLPALHHPPRLVVSRTRPAAEAVAVAERLGGDLIPMGSAGAKAMAVVRGEAEIYLHTGGQYEWDNCAPVAVAAAAGFHVSRVDGTPLRYNAHDTYVPDLLICRPEFAEPVLAIVRDLARDPSGS